MKFKKPEFFILSIILLCFFMGCSLLAPPDNFTRKEKVEYTTLNTLKSAKAFREFALASAGSVYKKGLMQEETKEKIIEIGDDLQQAINSAADALITYKQSGGLGEKESLGEKLGTYQALFNQFMEIVTPYILETPQKEVT